MWTDLTTDTLVAVYELITNNFEPAPVDLIAELIIRGVILLIDEVE